MKPILSCILLTFLVVAACGDGAQTDTPREPARTDRAPSDPDEEAWIQLFNGSDLQDWTVKIAGYDPGENVGKTFRVEDGLLKVRYDEYDQFDDRFGHLFYAEPFSYYILSVEYRFVGDQVPGGPEWAVRNSGMMVHAQAPETMEKDQDFPRSIEIQLLGGTGSGERSTGNLCTPGTHVVMNGELDTRHCINSSSATYHGDRWVRAEAIVLGDSLIQHVVEGDTVLQYTHPQIGDEAAPTERDGALLSEGYIALQSESHPIDFRTVELLPLAGCMDPEAVNYKSYYVESIRSECTYDDR